MKSPASKPLVVATLVVCLVIVYLASQPLMANARAAPTRTPDVFNKRDADSDNSTGEFIMDGIEEDRTLERVENSTAMEVVGGFEFEGLGGQLRHTASNRNEASDSEAGTGNNERNLSSMTNDIDVDSSPENSTEEVVFSEDQDRTNVSLSNVYEGFEIGREMDDRRLYDMTSAEIIEDFVLPSGIGRNRNDEIVNNENEENGYFRTANETMHNGTESYDSYGISNETMFNETELDYLYERNETLLNETDLYGINIQTISNETELYGANNETMFNETEIYVANNETMLNETDLYGGNNETIFNETELYGSTNETMSDETMFNGTIFNETTLNETMFNETMFNETMFNESTLNETTFNETMFNETMFDETTFNETMFNETLFNETMFNETMFNETMFNETKFNETMFNETMLNETDFYGSNNETMFNGIMVNETMFNDTMFNETMFNGTELYGNINETMFNESGAGSTGDDYNFERSNGTQINITETGYALEYDDPDRSRLALSDVYEGFAMGRQMEERNEDSESSTSMDDSGRFVLPEGIAVDRYDEEYQNMTLGNATEDDSVFFSSNDTMFNGTEDDGYFLNGNDTMFEESEMNSTMVNGTEFDSPIISDGFTFNLTVIEELDSNGTLVDSNGSLIGNISSINGFDLGEMMNSTLDLNGTATDLGETLNSTLDLNGTSSDLGEMLNSTLNLNDTEHESVSPASVTDTVYSGVMSVLKDALGLEEGEEISNMDALASIINSTVLENLAADGAITVEEE